ncbi:MAG: patatin-like phospholipase family protein [Caldilineaceae bacterium]|nr:patatin-like phospholipase family protein [Caldilineaceae bacterium]
MTSSYPFKNLVFRGGGIKSFAYHGVLYVLEEEGILPQIARVAGTSAGAVTATLVSFRRPVEETVGLFRTLDFKAVPKKRSKITDEWLLPIPSGLEASLGKVMGNVEAMNRLLQKYGLYSYDYSHAWMQQVIGRYCDGNERATFAEFQARGFRDLYVVTTNLNRHQEQIFSAAETPDVAVADALVLSQAIPLFFEAPRFDGAKLGTGDIYVDGGIVNDYPLQIFDQPKPFAEDNPWFISEINWETLGCRLFTPDDCPDPGYHLPIDSLIGYISNLLETIMNNQIEAHRQRLVDQLRSVDVNDCCVQATDFDIRPEDDDETYCELLAKGRQAATDYLAAYQPPDQNGHRPTAR